jgi:Zn-dependent M28 family amino/carboxypeptidase
MLTPLALAAALTAAEPDPLFAAEHELSESISAAELKAAVYRLASPEFQGRRGAGAARAARYVEDHFRALKLLPAFGDSYTQVIPSLLADKEDGDQPALGLGRNVGAVLPGSDPQLKDEWIVLSAHFDHLGQRGNRFYPGADDNASGTAMLMEVAERFALQKHRPKRTILFVAFDQEEAGLLGSTHFATKPPRDIKKLKAFLTADMLGRSMANLMTEYVYVLGSESSPGLLKLVQDNPPGEGLRAGRLGADIVGTRSDYGAFRDRKVPFLFFCTGMHPDYHRTTDTPDKIDYEKLRKISLWVHALTEKLADADAPPAWAARPSPPDPDEVQTVLALVSRVLDNPDVFPLTDTQKKLASGVRDRLTAMAARGTVTPAERAALLSMAQLLMVSGFGG